MKRIAWIVSAWIALLPSVQGAAFDCARAATTVEKLVCGDAELSKLDDELNAAYTRALERPDAKQRIVDSQKQWLTNARDACHDAECLKTAYRNRILELGVGASFGITVMRPAGATPPLAPASAPLAQSAVQSGDVPKAQAEAAASCGPADLPDTSTLPADKTVSQLVAISRSKLESRQAGCAVQALEQANAAVRAVSDGAQRAALGFDIKDVVLDTLEQKKLPDAALEKRLVRAGTQSLDADGRPLKTASEDERVDDAAFLGAVSDHYRNQRQRNAEFRQAELAMLELDFSLPANRRWAEDWRMQNFLATQQRKNYLEDMLAVLDGAQEDVPMAYRQAFVAGINQATAGHATAPLNLLSPDDARRDLDALTRLRALLKDEAATWGTHLYLAEAYWQTGDKLKARENLASARADINDGGQLYWIAAFLCNRAMSCPFGIYDKHEMAALLDKVEKLADTDSFIQHKLDHVQAMRDNLRGTAK